MSFFSFLFRKRFPGADERRALLRAPLTPGKALFLLFGLAALIVAFIFIVRLNRTTLVTVPAPGGALIEGIVGAPRFIHPLLATTETDEALTRLVYAGLMKMLPDGTPAPELAQHLEVSPSGQTYTFSLHPKLHFHDGSPLTSGDVAFTYGRMANPAYNPRTADFWQQIGVATPDARTIVITTTLPHEAVVRAIASAGILPAAAWEGITPEASTDYTLTLLHPIGAGAFKVAAVTMNDDGSVRRIDFARNHGYALGAPLLKTLSVAVYSNQSALRSALESGAVDFSFGLDAAALPSGASARSFQQTATAQTVGLYSSAHEPLLRASASAQAISRFIDRAQIIATVENGYGLPATNDPIASLKETLDSLLAAGYAHDNGVLTRDGTPVSLAIATANDPALVAAGRALASQLHALGIEAQVQAFDRGTFQEGVASGAYPVVLATEATMQGASNYQRSVALYAKAALLASKDDAHGMLPALLAARPLRYGAVEQWHARTDRVWPFFVKKEQTEG